jgi:uncharacterized protein YecE (DUF72 family)
MYYSDYGETALVGLADQMGAVAASPPWVIFDNTAHGFAVANAARLQELTADA